jgi:hypothetical protein
MTSRTDSQTRSTPSPARNASSSSDATDWDNAIGGNLLMSTCRYTSRIPPRAPSTQATHRTPRNPTTPGDSHPAGVLPCTFTSAVPRNQRANCPPDKAAVRVRRSARATGEPSWEPDAANVPELRQSSADEPAPGLAGSTTDPNALGVTNWVTTSPTSVSQTAPPARLSRTSVDCRLGLDE